jgi:glycerophosphoryl diester phosphodiesterase
MDWRSVGIGLRVGGHRGAAGEAPENTFAGFAVAARAGVDYLEFDVQLTSDGVAVIFHDDELDRTTDGHGPLKSATAAALGRLDAGAWFDPDFAGERIPSLAGVLAWLEARPAPGATIEAKGTGTGAAIARAIVASPARDRLSVCSFDAGELRAVAALDPAIPRLLIVDRDAPSADALALARDALATGVNLPWSRCDPDLVRRLQRVGLLVTGGTADDDVSIRACVGLGLDAVDSNRPTLTVAARDAAIRTAAGETASDRRANGPVGG